MEKITYLGDDLTYNEAVIKAFDMGMLLPNYKTMNAIIKSFRNNPEYTEAVRYLSSTTYAYDVSQFVDPHEEITFPYTGETEVETVPKTVRRPAYAISEGLTIEDIKTGNYELNERKP